MQGHSQCAIYCDALLKPPLPLALIPSHTTSQQRQFQFITISNHFKLTLLIHLTVVTKGLAEGERKKEEWILQSPKYQAPVTTLSCLNPTGINGISYIYR